jgi:hypothetical protein
MLVASFAVPPGAIECEVLKLTAECADCRAE